MLAFFPVLIPRPDARVIQFALSGIRSFMLGPDHAALRYDANERDRIGSHLRFQLLRFTLTLGKKFYGYG